MRINYNTRLTCVFNGVECSVVLHRYGNGRIAIQLYDKGDGLPYAKATVNMPDVKLSSREVIIKSYSENRGMREALMQAGIIGPAKRKLAAGFQNVHVHDIIADHVYQEPEQDNVDNNALEV